MKLVYILGFTQLLHGCASRSTEVADPCPEPGGGIRGRIVFQDWSPAVVELRAHYEGLDRGAHVLGETDEEGRFLLELQPDLPWQINVSWTGPWQGYCFDSFSETFDACDLSPTYVILDQSMTLVCT